MDAAAHLRSVARIAGRAVEVLTGTILAAQVVVLAYSAVQGIFAWQRQVLWLTEAAEHGLIQLAMLGAALALRAGAHQGIDALTGVMPPPLRRLLAAVNWLLIAGFGGLLAVLGAMYVATTASVGAKFASADVPTWPFYLCYPLAGGLLALFAFEKLLTPPGPDGGGEGADP